MMLFFIFHLYFLFRDEIEDGGFLEEFYFSIKNNIMSPYYDYTLLVICTILYHKTYFEMNPQSNLQKIDSLKKISM